MMPPRTRSDFEDLQASQLYCPNCKRAMPVRKRLLLVLLDRETFDYVSTRCGSPIGKKEEPLRKPVPRIKL
jgi:uncharacterized protein YbaR (Trm112 family)